MPQPDPSTCQLNAERTPALRRIATRRDRCRRGRRLVAVATLITAATVGAVCATTTPAAAAPKGGDSVTLTCRSISKRIDQLAAELGGHRAIPNDPRRAELSRLLDAWDELCARHFGANPRIFA